VIVSAKGCGRIRLPLVPVIVIEVTKASVPGSTLTVATDVIVPPTGGVTLGDENITCAPAGRELALRATAELNEPIDVTVTVSVVEPPAPTLRVGELSDNEKSALDVMVNAKEVVCVPDAPVPLMVMGLVATIALGATLIVRVAEALPPDGIGIGLVVKAEKVTPAGTAPVGESVTGPEKPDCEVPVIVTVPESPCGIETVGELGLRVKSGAVGVSLAILFAPLSAIQTLPAESAITSCGKLLPTDHSVNWPFVDPVLGLLAGVTGPGAAATGAESVGVIRTEPTPAATTVGAAPTTVPPADGSSTAILPLWAFAEFSAIHGFPVDGLRLISLGSAPTEGICHSLIVLSPRTTPT
jgi:hypothetical protein